MNNLEEELQKYTSIGNDEFSEAAELLLHLSRYKPYLSKDFNNALQKEVRRFLQNYQDFSVIKTKEITHTITHLEWT